jgi:hypothetical protein
MSANKFITPANTIASPAPINKRESISRSFNGKAKERWINPNRMIRAGMIFLIIFIGWGFSNK